MTDDRSGGWDPRNNNTSQRDVLNRAFKHRNCEVVRHFCAHGSNPVGSCRKPGARRRQAGEAQHSGVPPQARSN